MNGTRPYCPGFGPDHLPPTQAAGVKITIKIVRIRDAVRQRGNMMNRAAGNAALFMFFCRFGLYAANALWLSGQVSCRFAHAKLVLRDNDRLSYNISKRRGAKRPSTQLIQIISIMQH
ncbi:hypothetical protein A6U87_22930 [Rhizobium sp. AC44/96]|nr:hypothetical protein A6U87_22930 [Rhizobium sp. AC44/96]